MADPDLQMLTATECFARLFCTIPLIDSRYEAAGGCELDRGIRRSRQTGRMGLLQTYPLSRENPAEYADPDCHHAPTTGPPDTRARYGQLQRWI